MPETPSATEKKLTDAVKAWEQYAKADSFGDQTLAQFKTSIHPSLDARATIQRLELELKDALNQRATADVLSSKAYEDFVNGVIGSKKHGPDSTLYEALGYVRKSERKTGLTRKKKTNTPPD